MDTSNPPFMTTCDHCGTTPPSDEVSVNDTTAPIRPSKFKDAFAARFRSACVCTACRSAVGELPLVTRQRWDAAAVVPFTQLGAA